MELEIGMKFRSKWFDGITEILSINKQLSTLEVQISRETGHSHTEEWVLHHTIWGFERGEYLLIKND